MHAAVRRVLWSASKQPAIRIAGRRRAVRPFREFHVSRCAALAIEPSPNDQSNTAEPEALTKKHESTEKRSESTSNAPENSPARTTADGEGTGGPSADNGGGDNNRSSNYGSGARRSARKRKQNGIPPIKIPAWFLKHNVRLHQHDGRSTSRSSIEYGKDWSNWSLNSLRKRIDQQSAQETHNPAESEVQDFVKLAQDVESIITRIINPSTDSSSSTPQLSHSEEENQKHLDEAGELLSRFRQSIDSALERGTLQALLDKQQDVVPGCFKWIEKFRRTQVLPDLKTTSNENDERPFHIPPALMEEILALASAGLASSGPTKSHLNLLCPIDGASYFMDAVVEDIAADMSADMIRLDAQDLAQIAGDYVSEPVGSSNPLWKLGYSRSMLGPTISPFIITRAEEEADEEAEEDSEGDNEEIDFQRLASGRPVNVSSVTATPGVTAIMAGSLGEALSKIRAEFNKSGFSGTPFAPAPPPNPSELAPNRGWRNNPQDWNDMKMSALLISLLQAHRMKMYDHSQAPVIPVQVMDGRVQRRIVAEVTSSVQSVIDTGDSETNHNGAHAAREESVRSDTPSFDRPSADAFEPIPTSRLIIQIRGYRDLRATSAGNRIVERILEIVSKRQSSDQQILVIGTSASSALAPAVSGQVIESLQAQGGDVGFTTVVVATKLPLTEEKRTMREKQFNTHRLRYMFDVNARHIHNMSLRLQEQAFDPDTVDWVEFSQELRSSLESVDNCSRMMSMLENRVVSADEIQRIVSTAIGKKRSTNRIDNSSGELTGADIAASIELLEESHAAKNAWAQKIQQNEDMSSWLPHPKAAESNDPLSDRLKKKMSAREKALLRGVVNPDKIHVTFDDVHVPAETVEALKTLTTLSLKRPDAFKYGVLAKDKISGLLLYGPPGTGKTMLAKAVAKESGTRMLEVSGADMLDMYVGEGEKNIQAVFSLAKKLAPCVVFIDEADSIFASRNSHGQHQTHRELLNQFLKEWDGMQETTAFIMIATNRPFDIDQAALRRVPRRVLVDLPAEKDREAILRIHLKDEAIDPSVSIADLGQQTPLYSGSDLKNIAVAAALAAVREENDQAAKHTGDEAFQYPEKRILHKRHFDKALEEISASISEDMDTLGAIRKFDEKYGDKRGKKKKTVYGFTGQEEKKVDAAKVRS